jgi:hypothetical protein
VNDLAFRDLLRHPEITRYLYATHVDATPVVGTAQMACELARRVSKGILPWDRIMKTLESIS